MAETYKKILKDNSKVQVESAIRDGEGVKISTNYAKKSEIPDVSNFITKSVDDLTNYTLSTGVGTTIDLSINSSTYVVTLSLKNSSGTVLSTDTIDLPLESVVVSGSYDDATKKIVLTLQSGSTVEFSVADLVSGLQSEITSNNKLSSDLVDDTNNTNKFVTTSEKSTWNGKQDAITSSNKLDYSLLDNTPLIPSTASDVGALPNSTKYGASLSVSGRSVQLKDQDGNNLGTAITTQDTTYESKTASSGGTAVSLVTTGEKYTWNNKSDFSGSYNDLTDKPTIPTVPTNVSAFTNDAGYITSYTDTGATSVETTGDGNAVSSASYDSATRKLTLTKGVTALTSHQDISGKQDKTDNSLQTTATTVVGAINEVNSIAKESNKAEGYASYSALITALNSASSTKYKTGQSFYIQTLEVPDLWIISVESSNSTYTYTTDSAFITATGSSGGQQVGYYKLAQLETQKVDLSNYSLKSSTVSDVTYDSSNKKLKKTINGTTSDVVTFGANAFTNTAIPTTYVSSVNGNSGAVTGIATTSDIPTNKTASSGGTDTSLVTTGDKYTWNNKQNALPTTSTAGKVLKSTSTAGTVEWGNAPTGVTITTTSGSESISDGTNTLNFGSNAFTSTSIPTKVSDLTNDAGYTTNTGTITGVQLNGSTIASSGVANIQALPNYSLSIGSTNGGNPRQVLFCSVNYTNFDSNSGAYFKLGAMSGHGNGSSYTFVEDIFINVNYQGTVTCNVYKYVQSSVTLDNVDRNYGDIFWTIDTTNKIVYFYILLGQYSSAQFTPGTKIGASKAVTSTNGIVQYTGTPTYYSSGTKVWATGNSTLYARLSDMPDTSTFYTKSGGALDTGAVITMTGSNPYVGLQETGGTQYYLQGYQGEIGISVSGAWATKRISMDSNGKVFIPSKSIGDGTYTYTLPSKTGTFAMASDLGTQATFSLSGTTLTITPK